MAAPGSTSSWEAHMAEDGTIYYYDPRTGQSTWEKPDGFEPMATVSGHSSLVISVEHSDSVSSGVSATSTAAGGTLAATPHAISTAVSTPLSVLSTTSTATPHARVEAAKHANAAANANIKVLPRVHSPLWPCSQSRIVCSSRSGW
jgi:hypothetical protein